VLFQAADGEDEYDMTPLQVQVLNAISSSWFRGSWLGSRLRVSSRFLGPVLPSFRALSGRHKFTVRRHKFDQDSLPCRCPTRATSTRSSSGRRV
jgi:hypothetical protein